MRYLACDYKKLLGASDVRDKRAINHGTMREVIGGQLVRELIL